MQATASFTRVMLASASIAAAFVSTHASAITTTVQDLITTRNGVLHFMDSFNDGIAPPNAPNFANNSPASYALVGAAPTESGGKISMDSALGGSTVAADGTPSRTQRITLLSNADALNPTSGLKPSSTFAASALVDIAGASGPGSLGLRFDDRFIPPGGSGYTVSEMISIDFLATSQTIRFRYQDFVADKITTISTIAIPVAADQVRMMLLHTTADVNQVVAAAEFFDDGASLGVYALPGSSTIFKYNGFTRVELAAGENVTAVPEPETYAMMLIGVGLVGWQLRRRARAGRFLRLV